MAMTTKARLFAIAAALGAAIVSGLALGWINRSAGWEYGPLTIGVGLAVGASVFWFTLIGHHERLVIGLLTAIVGVGVFAWINHESDWKAQDVVPTDELDDLCVRVVALQICHERQVMGVFDFVDVPQPIREEAADRVRDEMSHADKLAMCDRIYGQRINADPQTSTHTASLVSRGAWLLLGVAASAVPPLVQQRWSSA
jgi:hypothetical protein